MLIVCLSVCREFQSDGPFSFKNKLVNFVHWKKNWQANETDRKGGDGADTEHTTRTMSGAVVCGECGSAVGQSGGGEEPTKNGGSGMSHVSWQ